MKIVFLSFYSVTFEASKSVASSLLLCQMKQKRKISTKIWTQLNSIFYTLSLFYYLTMVPFNWWQVEIFIRNGRGSRKNHSNSVFISYQFSSLFCFDIKRHRWVDTVIALILLFWNSIYISSAQSVYLSYYPNVFPSIVKIKSISVSNRRLAIDLRFHSILLSTLLIHTKICNIPFVILFYDFKMNI